MVSPQERLADTLESLRILQEREAGAIKTADLSRAQRELFVKNGFLQEVMKGWYIPIGGTD